MFKFEVRIKVTFLLKKAEPLDIHLTFMILLKVNMNNINLKTK